MQIIRFAQFTVVSQDTSNIKKGKGPYQIKESVGISNKGDS